MKIKEYVELFTKKNNVEPIFIGIGGSQLYGTNLDTSDFDIVGVFIPKSKFSLTNIKGYKIENIQLLRGQYKNTQIEGVMHSLSKFIELVLNGTPNVTEYFFVPEHLTILTTPIWEEFKKENLNKLLSKKVKHTFGGYAFSQLKRFTSYDKEKTDNPKRKELIDKYGWDTKKGMHTIRLLSECMELMVEGEIQFPRPERDYLKSIREGSVSIKEVTEKAMFLDKQITELYSGISVNNCILSLKPKKEEVWSWYIETIIKNNI